MSRAAKRAGWAVFALTGLGVGGIVLALLTIRSPLPGGGVAPGPDPAAYGIALGAVGVGAGGLALATAVLVELFVRLRRR